LDTLTPAPRASPPLEKLSRLDRFLPLWILLAMAAGVALGRFFPAIAPALDRVKVSGVSLPIAAGLLWMMFPVLAKVDYSALGRFAGNGRVFGLSLTMNWVVGPFIMFALAWVLLPDLPHYRTGLILVGLARCIAMVLLWNLLARGSNELAALLVALNSLFQIFMYSFLGYFFLSVLPGGWGAEGHRLNISMAEIAKSVSVFLGIPLLLGYATRRFFVKCRGAEWYDRRFMPALAPTALIGLLYTIVLMFSMQGDPQKNGDALGDFRHGDIKPVPLGAPPAGEDGQEEIAQKGIHENLKKRIQRHEQSRQFVAPPGQKVPKQDHGDAPGEPHQNQPRAVMGEIRQQNPGQREHDERSHNPIHGEGEAEDATVPGESSQRRVVDFGQDGKHHPQKARRDGQGHAGHFHPIQGRGDRWKKPSQSDAGRHGQQNPQGQESVEPGEFFQRRGSARGGGQGVQWVRLFGPAYRRKKATAVQAMR
jgi:arsenical-resistance protein